MKPFEPSVFPTWTGRVSPLRDARIRDIEVARRRMGLLIAFVVSAFLWVGIDALIRWAVG